VLAWQAYALNKTLRKVRKVLERASLAWTSATPLLDVITKNTEQLTSKILDMEKLINGFVRMAEVNAESTEKLRSGIDRFARVLFASSGDFTSYDEQEAELSALVEELMAKGVPEEQARIEAQERLSNREWRY